jgi:hypothetical protein
MNQSLVEDLLNHELFGKKYPRYIREAIHRFFYEGRHKPSIKELMRRELQPDEVPLLVGKYLIGKLEKGRGTNAVVRSGGVFVVTDIPSYELERKESAISQFPNPLSWVTNYALIKLDPHNYRFKSQTQTHMFFNSEVLAESISGKDLFERELRKLKSSGVKRSDIRILRSENPGHYVFPSKKSMDGFERLLGKLY